jgi:hypothetical protein
VDASVGFKTRKVTWLVKYADYRPRALASTRRKSGWRPNTPSDRADALLLPRSKIPCGSAATG